MDVSAIQSRLAAAGFSPGAVDGSLGPKTYAALFCYASGHKLGQIGDSLGRGAAKHFPAYDLNTPLRLAHFLAQAAHETMLFRYFVELGGPSYCAKYDGRRDLGNTQPGDGYRFRGRGIFQLTGRANYQSYGKLLGLDLIAHPEKAADPETSVLIACAYWRSRRLNALADRDDVRGITRKINGGANGLDDRIEHADRMKHLLT